MNLPSVVRSRPVLLTAGLFLLVALVCTQIPLLNYLGYEFSFLMALLASFASGLLAIRSFRSERPLADAAPEEKVRHLLRSTRQTLAALFVVLVVPVVVMTANLLFVRNCSFAEGLAFYLLLPAVSAVVGSSLGVMCAALHRLPRLGFVFWVAATVAYALALGYVTPAVFSFNPFYGYFPGLTYDEVLPITWEFVLYRVLCVAGAGAVLWLAVLVVRYIPESVPSWKKTTMLAGLLLRPRHRAVAAASVMACLLLYLFRCDLGFESTASSIRRTLDQEIMTEHFVIHCAQGSFTDEELRWLAAEHEFQRAQILAMFALPRDDRIESYVYPSVEVKRRLTGAGTTDIAKPWRREIHITRQLIGGTLKHELVHVIAGRFGVPVLQISLSTGLVEGLAMAVEWDSGNRTLHQYAAALRKFGLAPDIRRLMTLAGFASQSAALSYVVAGSFCRYLIDRYGIRRMTQVYRTLDYEGVYGRPLDALVEEWLGFLERIQVDDREQEMVGVFFRSPPIFEKVCARVVARRNAEARAAFRGKNYALAQARFRESYQESGGYEAFSGWLGAAFWGGAYDTLREAWDLVIVRAERQSQYLPLFLHIGDAFWALGDGLRADSLYGLVRAVDFSDAATEAATVRQLALRSGPGRSTFLHYLLAEPDDSTRLALLDSAARDSQTLSLARYLKGRTLQRLERWSEAQRLLEIATIAPLSHRLEATRLRALGELCWRQQQYDRARTFFWVSLNFHTSDAAASRMNTWIDRCEWMMGHEP